MKNLSEKILNAILEQQEIKVVESRYKTGNDIDYETYVLYMFSISVKLDSLKDLDTSHVYISGKLTTRFKDIIYDMIDIVRNNMIKPKFCTNELCEEIAKMIWE